MKLSQIFITSSVVVSCLSAMALESAPSAAYQGASFEEVWSVVQGKDFAARNEVETREMSAYQNGKLPQYEMNTKSIFGRDKDQLSRDAVRTTSQRFDYYDRLEKLLHPNGVCVAGIMKIDAQTPYTGALASGARSKFIGRISVAMEKTTKGQKRGFGFAGKVFPTDHDQKVVQTGNFFSVDELMGTKAARYLDVATTNEPDVGFDVSLIGLGMKIASALKAGDENPNFRPLTAIAKAGVENSTSVRQPKWVRFRAADGTIKNNQADFRNEVLQAVRENKVLKLTIEVSDTTKDRAATTGWTQIGTIELDQAVVSYGCDRRLHFAHPKLSD